MASGGMATTGAGNELLSEREPGLPAPGAGPDVARWRRACSLSVKDHQHLPNRALEKLEAADQQRPDLLRAEERAIQGAGTAWRRHLVALWAPSWRDRACRRRRAGWGNRPAPSRHRRAAMQIHRATPCCTTLSSSSSSFWWLRCSASGHRLQCRRHCTGAVLHLPRAGRHRLCRRPDPALTTTSIKEQSA